MPNVSIHAPTWGATRDCYARSVGGCVSIHAPTWGATIRSPCPTLSRGFQSTHPRGVRPTPIVPNRVTTGFQSTHPRGVRPLSPIMPTGRICFNPRTHVGCDLIRMVAAMSYVVSIHAPTWGATGYG